MFDYSLRNVKNVLRKLATLTTRYFGSGTSGFAASEDVNVAVCLSPETELSFAKEVRRESVWWPFTKDQTQNCDLPASQQTHPEHPPRRTGISGRQNATDVLQGGQQVTVLQLPASAGPKAELRTEPANWQLSLTEASAIGV